MTTIVLEPPPCDLIAEFVIPGEPASKARARFTKYGSTVRAYTPEKTRQGEALVAAKYLAVAKPGTDKEAAFAVSVEFLHETGQRRDVDNMLKLILDGLNKIAWPDDVQVTSISAVKRRVPKGDALTRVRIYTLGRIEKPRGKCIRCGTEFAQYASTSDRKFCTRKCGYAYRVEARERTCLQCGDVFLLHGPSKETQFCNRACNSAHKRVELACIHCGEAFTKPRSLANKGIPACSEECRAEYHVGRRALAAKGTCCDCGGPTSKKQYQRCRSCRLIHITITSEDPA